ncbi:MAG: hypothetical protein HQ567_09265, partial [Candidatus Nealsonbacteria bacterium]|nr:hypothetical protein [Candidatus Nealsonbacteria bacterium]
MIKLITRGLPLAVLTVALLRSSPAEARGLVLITRGETVKHLADLPEEQKKEIKAAVGTEPAIGFRYSYGGIFWLDFWTWDGGYCLFTKETDGLRLLVKEGDAWKLEPNEAAKLAGLKEGELAKPFFYTVPPGLLVVGVIVAIWIGVTLVKRSKDKQFALHLESVMNDPRYKRAMELIQEDVDRERLPDDEEEQAEAEAEAEAEA